MYENHVEISEAREENELLRLKLETAVQEAEEARRQTAAAQSGLAAALAGQTALSPRETSPTQPSSADVNTFWLSMIKFCRADSISHCLAQALCNPPQDESPLSRCRFQSLWLGQSNV